ncbi:MAG: DUF5675 family protein [Sphingobacterium sp.]|jgi:hypothetical protein|nr:DUF5675 family protein [Sphingobacterium sp.]
MKSIVNVKRIAKGENSTLSEIYVNGEFFCYGLEDSVRDYKIKGSTAIPAGSYKLGLNTYGAMNARYNRLFPGLHKGMIEIQGIPDFSYVYIHIGNNFGDTAGCLLVGYTMKLIRRISEYEIYQSKKAYKALYKRLLSLMAQGEVCLQICQPDLCQKKFVLASKQDN